MKKEKGNIIVLVIGAIVVIVVVGLLIRSWISGWVEGKVDELLIKSDVPHLVEIAEEDDSLGILINEYTVHAEKISELEKENESLKAKVAELSDAKDTIQSIFKTKDSN